jgi:hypothetical protein
MTDVRYLGTTHWTQTILDDDGKFKEFQMVAPGEVISVDGDVAKRFLQGPRNTRLFVEAGGPEDPESSDYVAQRSLGDGGSHVADVGRELGSNGPEGVAFRTEEDNEEGFDVAPPGTGADNEHLVIADEIQQEADAAKAKAIERRRSGSAAKSPSSKPSPTSSASSSSSNS